MWTLVASAVLMSGAAPVAAEAVSHLEGPAGTPTLMLRHEAGPGPSLIYVHGATFASGQSLFHRIDGRSWADDLRARGFDVWAFDFAGFGGSERPAGMEAGAPGAEAAGRAEDASRQVERVIEHVRKASPGKRLAILAHSWGTVPAGMATGRRPDLVDALILFGPLTWRGGSEPARPSPGGYRLVSAAGQWASFQAGIPAVEGSPIALADFTDWARAYLASDPDARTRSPQAVRIPTGPAADVAAAWAGDFPYDPAIVRVPTLIVRGAWDPVSTDADVAWLKAALRNVPGGAHDQVVPRGGHRLHLERNREALFDAVGAYLADMERGWTGEAPQ